MLQKIRKRQTEGGFTLIELLIVIVILGILAAIVVFAVGSTGKDATSASCQSDVKTVETAAEAYKAQSSTGSYAASVAALVSASYLREAPKSDHYTISTDTNGGVTVVGTASDNDAPVGGTLDVGDTTDTAKSICAKKP